MLRCGSRRRGGLPCVCMEKSRIAMRALLSIFLLIAAFWSVLGVAGAAGCTEGAGAVAMEAKRVEVGHAGDLVAMAGTHSLRVETGIGRRVPLRMVPVIYPTPATGGWMGRFTATGPGVVAVPSRVMDAVNPPLLI